jgi:hypothetical protein
MSCYAVLQFLAACLAERRTALLALSEVWLLNPESR